MIEQTNSEILLLNSLFLSHYIPYWNIEKICQNANKNLIRRNSGMEFSFFPSSTIGDTNLERIERCYHVLAKSEKFVEKHR